MTEEQGLYDKRFGHSEMFRECNGGRNIAETDEE